jgi:hypothetical protein
MLMRRQPAAMAPRHIRPAAVAMSLRCVTALLGGYAAATGIATLIARLLPVARVEATLWGMTLSALCYAVLALWCFAEARLARVMATVWGIAIVTIALAWALGVRA